MSKQQEVKQGLERKRDVAILNNPLQTPAPGIYSGSFGDLFENVINYSFGLLERAKVTQKQDKIDCIKYGTINGEKKRIRIEIKQGSSALARLNPDGTIKKSMIRKSDFVCYHPRFIPQENFIEQAVKECIFFTVEEFFEILSDLNLIRTKKADTKTSTYKDVECIQTFFDRKSLGRFYNVCERLYFEGMDYQTFVQTYNVSSIINF